MDDKCLMESLLMSVKGVCDLYLHGTIESNTEHVHSAFDQALCNSLTIQNEIYKNYIMLDQMQNAHVLYLIKHYVIL